MLFKHCLVDDLMPLSKDCKKGVDYGLEPLRWLVLPFDQEAADLFRQFQKQRIRICTMDLKIACITIAHDATLLTRNTVDFAQVPGLRFENWLD